MLPGRTEDRVVTLNSTHTPHYVGDVVISVIIPCQKLIDPVRLILREELGIVKVTQLRDHDENLLQRETRDVCSESNQKNTGRFIVQLDMPFDIINIL